MRYSQAIAAAAGFLLWTSLAAAVGEPGGAYGGGTLPETGEVRFQEADQDGDGLLSREEARRAGIERFEEGDRDGDGALDRAEFSALEGDGAEESPARDAPGGSAAP